VALDTQDGSARLDLDDARGEFARLSMVFETQVNRAFCGPATIAMILNAVGVARPEGPALGRGLFTQANVFTERVRAIKPPELVEENGMSLSQLGAMLAAHDLAVTVRHASATDRDAFRREATAALDDPRRFVAVNYLRTALGQDGRGHISPLAAYDEASDSFLILDVARYRYPPVWVTTTDLFNAMNTSIGDVTRGYVVAGPT
jgi:hypothetical protein